MACAMEAVTRSVVFRASDGSVFYVGAHGDSPSSVVNVQWRGVDICADCFLDQLDDDEMRDLEAHLRSRGARDV